MYELKENNTLVEGHESLLKLRSTLFSNEPCKIVELGSHALHLLFFFKRMTFNPVGAGIGLVSVALAVLRSGTLGQDGDVILTTDVGGFLSLHCLQILFFILIFQIPQCH